MHELKLKSNFEINIYKKLKNIAKKKQWKIRKENDKYIVNNNMVEIVGSNKIRVNGRFCLLKNLELTIN